MPDQSKLAELVAQMPKPDQARKILANADKEAMDKALAEMHAGGRETLVALVDMLQPDEKGGDSQVRHALHALATKAAGMGEAERKAFAESIATTLGGGRHKDARSFVIRQLQLVGGAEAVAAIGATLNDDDLVDTAAAVLVAIGGPAAAEQLRTALDKATDRQRPAIIQSLGVLRDAEAAALIRKSVNSSIRDVHLTALWSLANIGDAASAEALLKAADGATEFDRARADDACLILAERLKAAGKTDEARKIYLHLRNNRTDEASAHVASAARRGLGEK